MNNIPVIALHRAAKALGLKPIRMHWESGSDARDCRRVKSEAKEWLARHPEAFSTDGATFGEIRNPRRSTGWYYACRAKEDYKRGNFLGGLQSLRKDILFHAPKGAF